MRVQAIPILPSPNFDETAAFYAALGFEEEGRWPNEYLILTSDEGIEFHFWFNPTVDSATNDVACYVRCGTAAQAQAFYDEWSARGLESGRLHEPTTTDYGLLEFALVDLHGNLIRVGGSVHQGLR